MGHESIKLELIEWLSKLEDDETINYLKIVKESRSSDDWWNDLTENQKITHKIAVFDTENDVKEFEEFRYHSYPFNQISGNHLGTYIVVLDVTNVFVMG